MKNNNCDDKKEKDQEKEEDIYIPEACRLGRVNNRDEIKRSKTSQMMRFV